MDRSTFPTETKKVLEHHSDEVFFIAFSHAGKYLASASKDASAIIYDVEKEFAVFQRLQGHEDAADLLERRAVAAMEGRHGRLHAYLPAPFGAGHLLCLATGQPAVRQWRSR